ncbi:HD-domain/PDEase-like protein [Imleria badia]|nr:HD-domain/PDEase-like protein [Imleria badia]
MLDNEDYAHGRRRSIDVGGLALALENQGLGHGWGSWDQVQQGETRYAELLCEMCAQTQTTVTHYDTDPSPIEIPPETRRRLIRALDSWHFEPHKLPDEEVLFCAQILFESLFEIENMQNDTGVSLNDISIFLKHLQRLYCGQNSYHNFQHALDVLQACQAFLCAAAVVPPVSILCRDARPWWPDKRQDRLVSALENMDLFALFIAAIGHDVGHPGFTNMFMKNADAPLSAVFDGKSALEQMHYAILIQVIRHHGLGSLLDRPNGGQAFRKILAGIVLATDMHVHFEFMKNFRLLVAGKDFPLSYRKLLLCQAFIKCADISNPSRPPGVSHYWANALMAEWNCQASLERLWQLPPSVQLSETPLAQVQGQIFFISTFAKPLLDITAKGIPEMQQFAGQCTSNLAMWEARDVELTSTKEVPLPSPKSAAPARSPADFLTSFPLALPTFVLSYQDDQQPAGEWHSYSPSSPISSSSSDAIPDNVLADQLSPPASPSPSVGSTSFVLAPRSSSSSLRASSTTSGAAAAMRAAYEAGVRKKRSFYNRLSWTADVSPVSSMTNLAATSASHPKAIATNTTHVDTPHSPYAAAVAAGVVAPALPGREARCTVGSVQ